MGTERGMIWALRDSTGNARAVMLTEPMWGVPFHLYMAFASVYMLALGVTDVQIGLVTSVGLLFQVVFALLGGPITDKLGRKRTTLLFDLVAWSIPTLIWTFARGYDWFLAAAVMNSFYRITMTSWTCLFVEDSPRDKQVHYWAWVYVAGIIAGFFAPLTGVLIGRFSLVPTMRGVYFFAFVLMTLKFILLNIYSKETEVGLRRIEETRGVGLIELLSQTTKILRMIFTNRKILTALGLFLVLLIYNTIRNTFWSVLMTEGLGFEPEVIGWFPALRSVVMLAVYLLVLPQIDHERVNLNITAGFISVIVGTLFLVLAPVRGYPMVITATILEASGVAILAPFMEALMVHAVVPGERARIISLNNVIVLALTTPFGWLGGVLSEAGKTLPFWLLIVLMSAGAVYASMAKRTAMSR